MTFQHDNLRCLMALKSLTSKEVAEAINVSAITVSNWKRGVSTPQSQHLSPLAKYLEVEIAFFFGKINILVGSESA